MTRSTESKGGYASFEGYPLSARASLAQHLLGFMVSSHIQRRVPVLWRRAVGQRPIILSPHADSKDGITLSSAS